MEGFITKLDETSQVLTLKDVVCENGGEAKRFPGLLEVFGSDIRSLEALPQIQEEDSNLPSTTSTPSKNKKKLMGGKALTREEIKQIKSEDFDFESSLKRFDKQQIFADIQVYCLLIIYIYIFLN